MAVTSIEWSDVVWNPVRGCTKVSPGCAHCYAEMFAERFRGVPGHPYEQGFDLRLVPEKLLEPLSWKKPRRVFVNSMSDLFQDPVPDVFIDQVLAVMALTPQHTYQVLTKRAKRMLAHMRKLSECPAERLGDAAFHLHLGEDADCTLENIIRGCSWWRHMPLRSVPLDGRHPLWPLPNVWLGVSVENQHFADERIPLLLQTPAAVRFISAEPLLGPVDLFAFLRGAMRDECLAILNHIDRNDKSTAGLDWVIVGGESGAGARPNRVEWVRSIVAQCKAAGVSCFVKQLGSVPVTAEPFGVCGTGPLWLPTRWPRGTRASGDPTRPGVLSIRLHHRKGGAPDEWPADLRVREFPKETT